MSSVSENNALTTLKEAAEEFHPFLFEENCTVFLNASDCCGFSSNDTLHRLTCLDLGLVQDIH